MHLEFPLALLHAALSLAIAAPPAATQSGDAGQTATARPAGAAEKREPAAMHMQEASTLEETIVEHHGSGTSVEPASAPAPMLMTLRSGWMLMLHGVAFVLTQQQSGRRGADKFFSSNWSMGMAQRDLGRGTLTLRAMLSLEPATISNRSYPELFQVGETAYGRPLVDAQHPHNFFMELGGFYDLRLGKNALLSAYAAVVGDPALGPPAFPHRTSASEDPLAVLGHHLQDSTHISADVFTLGAAYRVVRVEFSGFHGREPGENRWTIEQGRPDSWAARLTVNPLKNWSAQYSIGRVHSPEAISPQEDVLRMTASVDYNRPLTRGNWASIVVWGRNKTLPEGEIFNSYLLESLLRFADRNAVWTRVENVDRSTELLLGQNPAPPGFVEKFLARIQAYSIGYDRDLLVTKRTRTALGAQVTVYGVPGSLQPLYGNVPVGVAVFLRFRPDHRQ